MRGELLDAAQVGGGKQAPRDVFSLFRRPAWFFSGVSFFMFGLISL